MISTTPEPGLRSLGADAKAPVTAVGSLVGAMWVSELIDTIDGHRLDQYGVQPRTLIGLRGIVFAPFLHVGWQHLIGNTVPFAILGVLIALSGVVRFVKANVIIALCSGAGMWVFGQSGSVHLGASGMVFGYLGFLLSRGFFDRRIWADRGWRNRRCCVRRPAVGSSAHQLWCQLAGSPLRVHRWSWSGLDHAQALHSPSDNSLTGLLRRSITQQ
jgi:Rhomboid family